MASARGVCYSPRPVPDLLAALDELGGNRMTEGDVMIPSQTSCLMDRAEQLARIQAELAEAARRAHEVAAPFEDERWGARPARDQWSVAECLIHLNMTSRAFLPLIKDAIGKSPDRVLISRTPYRLDFVGRLLWLAATVQLPIKTTGALVPPRAQPKDAVLSEFHTLQNQLMGCLAAAEGLDLGTVRIVSPFDARLKYNLYSCLRLIPAHQRQHLRQAERVVQRLRAAS